MAHLEWFLSFAEITFPLFLLLPTLVTSLHVLVVPLRMVATFYGCALAEYVLIVSAITYSLVLECARATLAFFAVSVIIVSIALYRLLLWSLQEFVWAELRPTISDIRL
jgi:hypothetical protein